MNKTDFNGKGEEYFRIWIVNTLLSIVTLGIYSAWAKVKNTKYLYQNLSINNHRFNYHAQPIQILKGRLIAIFTLFLVTLLGLLNDAVYFISIIAFIFLAPWLINKSLSFNMRMTSYRNVRFDFQGDYWNTFIWIFIAPFFSIFTLYLALPHFLRKADEYSLKKLENLGIPKDAFIFAMQNLIDDDNLDNKGKIVRYLSTHPQVEERIEIAKKS